MAKCCMSTAGKSNGVSSFFMNSFYFILSFYAFVDTGEVMVDQALLLPWYWVSSMIFSPMRPCGGCKHSMI